MLSVGNERSSILVNVPPEGSSPSDVVDSFIYYTNASSSVVHRSLYVFRYPVHTQCIHSPRTSFGLSAHLGHENIHNSQSAGVWKISHSENL